MQRRALLFVAAILLASCTANAPHRLSPAGEAVEARVQTGDLTSPEGRRRLESSALEVHDDYKLLFLEFDDQGTLFSRAPLDLLVKTLREEADQPAAPRLSLIVFAHGWKSDARLCNRNACCFRSLLSRLAADSRTAVERSGGAIGASRTIGIFIGWRGLSATVPPFRELSFYPRKRAAQAIGQGELVEVLAFLDSFQKSLNARDPLRCRLVILGHSFGGAMVYSAVANVLKSRIVNARVRAVRLGADEPIDGFGDLVVLANPAFEAALYQPFQELIGSFPHFSSRQRPVLVILASETDSSTRVFFKVGRIFDTLFQRTGPRSPRAQLVTAVGNYEPFITHRAVVRMSSPEEPAPSLLGTVAGCQCRLPMTEPSPEDVEQIVEIFRSRERGVFPKIPSSACPGVQRFGCVDLECMGSRPSGLPFWVIKTSDRVMSGHSGFFTMPVTDLIRGMIARALLQDLADMQSH